jgi:L-ascorbate metabolism protein UlaG (beta-lactamase superfamily)
MTSQGQFESDIIPTSAGEVVISFLGHGSLMFGFDGMNIYVDPFSAVADYSKLPPADLILLTHEHQDHLDPVALAQIRNERSVVILAEVCARQVKGGIVMHNGDERTVNKLRIQAVPAYNLVHMRGDGQPYHPKGTGNGYVLTFGDQRVYVAGDTENIPEMKDLKGITCAFLPMNIPYTMTPEMAADAARSFQPKILYPYHFGQTVVSRLSDLLKDAPQIEVRVRKLA